MILLGAVLLSACAGGAVRGTSWPGLAADGKTAYLADGPFVYAVNLSDGKELWKYPGSRSSKLIFYAPPAITPDGLVIVGSAGTDHSLIALNPTDINPETKAPVEAWKFTGAKDHWVAAPLVLNNKLVRCKFGWQSLYSGFAGWTICKRSNRGQTRWPALGAAYYRWRTCLSLLHSITV